MPPDRLLDDDRALPLLRQLYGDRAQTVLDELEQRLSKSLEGWQPGLAHPLDQRDAMLITYGDQFRQADEAPLNTLRRFVSRWLGASLSAIHLLPHYPYSSDDGFSVIDYREVDPALGTWTNVQALNEHYDLMFDAVINHISAQGPWFAAYRERRLPERDFFIEDDGSWDVEGVVRPRTSPLFTEVETEDGPRWIWTTFSADQVDLDYRNPELLGEIVDLLLFYIKNGAAFLRLDAIGFLWKRSGTTCLHLDETHAVIKLLRLIFAKHAPAVRLITETNVPHEENVSYFGDGHDEAQLVYNFSLAPLTLDALLTGDATVLSDWAKTLAPPSEETSFFNFLASHDGIGLRPAEGLLSAEAITALADRCLERGGQVSYRSGPSGEGKRPYELNSTLFDLLAVDGDEEASLKRFIAAHAMMFALQGVPGIYVHSLFGSSNWREGFAKSGAPRTLNRQKFEIEAIEAELNQQESRATRSLAAIKKLLDARQRLKALSPSASQEVLTLHPAVLALERWCEDQHLIALTNFSAQSLRLGLNVRGAWDELGEERIETAEISLDGYHSRWLTL